MQCTKININENQMETTIHGTAEFPIAVYETVLAKNILGYVDWHWHNELQLCYITAGKVQFKANQEEYMLTNGEGIFINSGCLHTARPLTPDAAYVCIDVSPSLLSGFPGSILERKYILSYIQECSLSCFTLSPAVEWQNHILINMHLIHRLYYNKAFAYELEIVSLLLITWKEILQYQEAHPGKNIMKEQKRIKQILSYIHTHYAEKLSLKDISKEVHLCPSECCRYFKRYMNCSIFEYLTNYRISQGAILLLEKSDLSVSDIAYEIGFSDTSYFIRLFREKLGHTPLAYKNLNL